MTTKTYRNPLDIISKGYEMPEGCDSWGLKSVRADLRTSHGYRWPYPGNWARCDESQIDRHNTDPCPNKVGDGLCVGLTYYGMAGGDISARILLLVAYHSNDVLGQDSDKLRVSQTCVVDLLDKEITNESNR